MSENEREIRAFEAIIASQLHRERDPMNLDDLSPLTESQREKMNALPANLVDSLWDAVDQVAPPSSESCESKEEQEEENELAGMNRAEEMDEYTRIALEEARKEIIESMKNQRMDRDCGNS